jgi:excisionase family DNA binding protein
MEITKIRMYMVQDEYLTKSELQKLLKISRGMVDKLMKEIPYIKLGKKVLFRKSDIDAYLEKKTVNK